MQLSKSDFLKYQVCPSYFWLWKHRREVVPDDTEAEVIKQRLEQGNELERYARLLFPDGVLVTGKGSAAVAETEAAIASGATTIFQATVQTESGLFAMADVLQRNEQTGAWDLYEIKSTNSVKKEHYADAAFQRVAFEAAGYAIGNVCLMHTNKDYRRHGQIDPNGLLVSENITPQIAEILPDIRQQISDALAKLADTTEPHGCSCRLKSRSNHCPTFAPLNPDVPEYSVFNITRLTGKKLAQLVDADILNIHDVPEDTKLSNAQAYQVHAAKTGETHIDHAAIAAALGELTYPLYFIDYESLNKALPRYEGTWPYQQVVFQYSLHVLRAPGAELEHYEYVHTEPDTHPIPPLLASMREHIGPTGSVIVWYKPFETTRNKEMALALPEYVEFLSGINERIYDLMEIFSKQLYVHPGFKGSASIKKVLPVLVPEFSYQALNIQKGDIAALRWDDAITGAVSADEAAQTYADLREYCALDTLAMVRIYEKLPALSP